MSKITFLNLDEMAPVRRNVTLFGKSYPVKDMTVQHFIEMNSLAEELESKKVDTPVEAVNATVRSVTLSLEGCDESVINRLTVEQLAVLSRFIRNELVPAATEATEATEAGNAQAQPTQG